MLVIKKYFECKATIRQMKDNFEGAEVQFSEKVDNVVNTMDNLKTQNKKLHREIQRISTEMGRLIAAIFGPEEEIEEDEGNDEDRREKTTIKEDSDDDTKESKDGNK